MVTYTAINKSLTRVDGLEKVTGRRQYAADVPVNGALWGRVLRSSVPHARIASIDVSAARALPGVRVVLAASDLPPVLIGRRVYDMPLLATDRVRFIGEKVAAVAADDPDMADAALDLIRVEYEELPAVFDAELAMQPDAPVLHPDMLSYRNLPRLSDVANVHSYVRWGKGDVERGFAEAEIVLEDRFSVPMQHPAFIEPHACAVHARADGLVQVWTSTKQPFQIRDWLAEAVGVPSERVTVLPVSVGGDFGGKGYLVDEPLAFHLSRATGRPVRMPMSYAEELTAGVPRHGAVVAIKTGLTADGRLVAQHARLIFNSGAYAANKPHREANLSGAEAACGVYRTPNTLIESYCVYTNQVPCGHMRGPGWMQAAYAIESHLDMIARRIHVEPIELRRMNVVDANCEAPTGHRWRNAHAREVLDLAAEMAGSPVGNERPAVRAGRGVALSYEHIGVGQSGAVLSVDENGRVRLVTGVPDVGTGAHTIFRQLVAEVLTIAPNRVEVIIGDTSLAPYDSGSGGDRVTHVAGNAVLQAALRLRDALCELAPELMGWPEGRARLEDGEFRVGEAPEAGTQARPTGSAAGAGAEASGAVGPAGAGTDAGPTPDPSVEGRGVPFAELAGRIARASGGQVQIRHELAIEGRVEERNFTATVADVEVDTDTGQVTVTRLVSVQDIGTVLNPRLAQGQVEGGAITGLGYAVMEDLRSEDGRVVASHLGDYKIPSIADVPDLRQAFLPNAEGPAPFGSKPVGEVSLCGVAPAIANAVHDAVGVRINELPVTAERVYRRLRDRARAAGA